MMIHDCGNKHPRGGRFGYLRLDDLGALCWARRPGCSGEVRLSDYAEVRADQNHVRTLGRVGGIAISGCDGG